MFKVTLILRAIALSFIFHALRTRGVQLRPTIQELKENDSVLHDFVHGSTKQNLKSLNSNSIEAITFGHDPTWDKPFFALHATSYGGPDDNYYGLHTTMGVYNHKLTPGQWSGAAIWVYHDGDGAKSSFNSIHVGWHIHLERYGDSHPHFFTQWTRDGHVATGCVNMDCPGFVRASGSVIAPGDAIQQVSDVADGHIPNITLRVLKDQTSGDWWVYYGFHSVPTGVGYFPRSSFTYLADKAKQMAFGGAVVSIMEDPTPPMGSGFLPNDGLGRAAAFTDLRIINQDGSSKPILEDLLKFVTDEKCHSIAPINNGAFLYGGPGNCVR